MLFHDESLALFVAGRQAESIGQFDKARYYYCLAVSIEPDNAAYIQATANLARRLGRQRDAQLLFEAAIESARCARNYPNARMTALVCEALVA